MTTVETLRAWSDAMCGNDPAAQAQLDGMAAALAASTSAYSVAIAATLAACSRRIAEGHDPGTEATHSLILLAKYAVEVEARYLKRRGLVTISAATDALIDIWVGLDHTGGASLPPREQVVTSMTQWHAAGFDIEDRKELENSVRIAMSRATVPDADRWRYFCGIVWNTIRSARLR